MNNPCAQVRCEITASRLLCVNQNYTLCICCIIKEWHVLLMAYPSQPLDTLTPGGLRGANGMLRETENPTEERRLCTRIIHTYIKLLIDASGC